MFKLNYHTGAGNSTHDTIDEAMEAVSTSYTGVSITIDDEDGTELYKLPWWGVAYNSDEDEDAPHSDFGDNGYYGPWIEL